MLRRRIRHPPPGLVSARGPDAKQPRGADIGPMDTMCDRQPNRMPSAGRAARAQAFTLIEVLIVVVILGILASVVIPQFSNASQMTRENTLKDDLRYLRTQIVVFKAHHRDVPPGYQDGSIAAGFDTDVFIKQLVSYTDENCHTSDTGNDQFKYGPYLTKMPVNPLNSKNDIQIFNGQPSPDGQTGWLYNPQTQEILANLVGKDRDDTPFINY
jgi:general secretion pathway protein G